MSHLYSLIVPPVARIYGAVEARHGLNRSYRGIVLFPERIFRYVIVQAQHEQRRLYVFDYVPIFT